MAQHLIDFLETTTQFDEPFRDITSLDPDLSIDDSYRLQFELMERRARSGDKIVGYKAAGTSPGAQDVIGESSDILIGTLLHSHVKQTGTLFTMREGTTYVEAEMAILLGCDLAGPNATFHDAVAATKGVMAAIEVAPWSPSVVARKRSPQHALATLKAEGCIVLSSAIKSLDQLDLRTEGAVMTDNEMLVASGTGANVLNNPLNVVAAIANHLSHFERRLHAGMVVMTGSIMAPHGIASKDGENEQRCIRVDYSSLGSVGVSLS